MNSKLKLVAGPRRVSVRLFTTEEIAEMGLENLGSPLCYGLITSMGWNFSYLAEEMVIIFDINNTIKLNPDTHIIEEKDIIGKLIHEKKKKKDAEPIEVTAYEGLADEISVK